MNEQKKVNNIYRAIKICEGIIIFVVGLIVCIFSGNQTFQEAISYCVATVALIFGLLTITFAYLFSKGIASVDTISGSFMVALGVLIIINPEIITQFIPLFFGILLIVYSCIFLIQTIVYYLSIKVNKNNLIKAICYTILDILLITGAILVFVFMESVNQRINVLIGIILMLLGISLFIFTLVAPKNKLKEEYEYEYKISHNKNEVSKNFVVDTTATTKKRTYKRKPKTETTETTETALIEHKEN